ncbi:hypothetical protein FF38_13451 [Lucilia cuprina]|uniref:Uncharacterized protein n=1 Tax=Lucilia cuprina TaxID=7375 RepID=A0A0L0BRR6_LUCCU|nr:hypothetical protein CVS40_9887 [Lucilia cuprina]KNC21884.1 hypothetical protein FF38_13451 [Lucilia cuprina]
MSSEDGNEDRLTKSEFAELIQHLSVQEILSIEYRIGSKWSKLFSRNNVSPQLFVCNLCVLDTSSFKNLLAHIDGRKHKLQMERVNQLYHSDYTYPKCNKKEPVDKTVTKMSENPSLNSTFKGVPNKTSLATNDQLESKMLQSKTKSKSSIVKSSINLENNSANKTCILNNENKTNYSVEIQSAIIDNEVKHDENERETSSTASKIISSNKCIQNEANNDDTVNLQFDIEAKSSKVSDSEILNLEPSMNEKNPLSPEIVEKIPLAENKTAEANLNEVDIKINSVKKSLEETKKMRNEVAEKRSLSANKIAEEKVKKAKIVINPAAALSLKAIKTNENKDKDGNEKPQYQTNKIIIPTVHKNKSQEDNKSSPPPNFFVKSYSSKPSDNDIHGILGVEYVIKILKSRHDISPRYECGLCELVLDGFAMQKHLEGYNHRLKFCEKHFPTAIRHYRQYMQNIPDSELFKVMTPVLAKLAIAIEQHHGRNLPYECYERDFNLNRHEILAKAFSCRHASEQYGPTFTHVVGSKEIDEFINNRHKYFPTSSSRTTIFDTKPGSTSRKSDLPQQNFRTTDKESNSRDRHRHAERENLISHVSQRVDHTYKSYMSSGLYEDIYPPVNTYNQVDNRNVNQQVDDATYKLMVDDFLKGTLKGISGTEKSREKRKLSSTPVHNLSLGKRKSLSPLRQNDIWQAYRHMVDQELHNLDERFKQYRIDPETHPSYNDEWQKFWKRRKDELVKAGLDHRKYNYQPEWVRFIKIRLEELYGQEVENLKIKSRERLCLPLTNENVTDQKYQVQTLKKCTSNITTTECNSDSTDGLNTNPAVILPSRDNAPQVVSVLRLMTALEDSLGSLGPKIIDLFSKALQAEKNNPLHVNSIILTDDNCALIETAKEKFKGLVITGLFEGSKKRVLKQVVNDAEALLKYGNQFRQQLATQRSSIEFSINRSQSNSSFLFDSVSVNTSGASNQCQVQGANQLAKKYQSSLSTTENLLSRMDKKELASKLAASLVAQGKTDFDPQQLQQLIAVYKLIEKKKRENACSSQTNKSGYSLSESSSSTKKTLSDTLSDLLKSQSASYSNTGSVQSVPSASHLNQILGGRPFSLNIADVQENNLSNPTAIGNFFPSSVLQNSSDNYFNNAAQSTANTYEVSGDGGRSQLQLNCDYGFNYTNNPHQINSSMRDSFNNQQHQNGNGMTAQNWGWNTNLESNQNYNMGEPNNNCNQNTNWQHF